MGTHHYTTCNIPWDNLDIIAEVAARNVGVGVIGSAGNGLLDLQNHSWLLEQRGEVILAADI